MVNQPIGNHGLESSGVVGFDLGPLLIIHIYVLCKHAEI